MSSFAEEIEALITEKKKNTQKLLQENVPVVTKKDSTLKVTKEKSVQDLAKQESAKKDIPGVIKEKNNQVEKVKAVKKAVNPLTMVDDVIASIEKSAKVSKEKNNQVEKVKAVKKVVNPVTMVDDVIASIEKSAKIAREKRDASILKESTNNSDSKEEGTVLPTPSQKNLPKK